MPSSSSSPSILGEGSSPLSHAALLEHVQRGVLLPPQTLPIPTPLPIAYPSQEGRQVRAVYPSNPLPNGRDDCIVRPPLDRSSLLLRMLPVAGEGTAGMPPPHLLHTPQDSMLACQPTAGAAGPNSAAQRDRPADNNSILVTIHDRKVRITSDSDPTSLYALCRRWVRNDAPKQDQPASEKFVMTLPRPLPAVKHEMDALSLKNTDTDIELLENFLEGKIEIASDCDLLQSHMKHFKDVRKRAREDHLQKIGRFKHRLNLLLQPNSSFEKE